VLIVNRYTPFGVMLESYSKIKRDKSCTCTTLGEFEMCVVLESYSKIKRDKSCTCTTLGEFEMCVVLESYSTTKTCTFTTLRGFSQNILNPMFMGELEKSICISCGSLICCNA
jgi:hypothetical protein